VNPVVPAWIIPLPAVPELGAVVLNFLPFRGLGDTPFRLYMGHIPPEGVVWVLAQQLAWTAALVMLGRLGPRAGRAPG